MLLFVLNVGIVACMRMICKGKGCGQRLGNIIRMRNGKCERWEAGRFLLSEPDGSTGVFSLQKRPEGVLCERKEQEVACCYL